ncbi:kinase-like protein, partial [Patellaria atrata CBS 101060]
YELSKHPVTRAWSTRPRTYAVLRMLGCGIDDDVAAEFIDEKLEDVTIPYTNHYLPSTLRNDEDLSRRFLELQQFVLSDPQYMKASNFSQNSKVWHRHIRDGDVYFEDLEKLGEGGSARVARVQHRLSGEIFARKIIWRGHNISEQRTRLVEFQQELQALKRIRHRHLITCIGSYTDKSCFALLMSPVADYEMKYLLRKPDPLSPEEVVCLRNAFGCLATAIAYLHANQIRHKDIKPGNILVREGTVYLCDFGLARDWSEEDHSTTSGPVGRYTKRYVSPEVINEERRNELSDIWSLGCVFLEMISVLKKKTLDEMDRFLASTGTYNKEFWSNPDGIKRYMRE